jgi:hypothetical protein
MAITINTYCRINRNGSININTDPTFGFIATTTTSTTTTTTTINLDDFACVSGVGVSGEVIGTYQFNGFTTENGITRPSYIPTFIPAQPSLQIVIYNQSGGAVWAIAAFGDEVNYYFGNTNPAPAYPWLETSWTGSPPPTVTQGPC